MRSIGLFPWGDKGGVLRGVGLVLLSGALAACSKDSTVNVPPEEPGGICGTGMSTGDEAGDACITEKCCKTFEPCAADEACAACLGGGEDGCSSNSKYKAAMACINQFKCLGGGGSGGSGGTGGSAGSSGSCTQAKDCAGQLCVSGTCKACSKDSECSSAYGSGYKCTGGKCVTSSCVDDSDCSAQGQLCVSHSCTPCDSNVDCTNSTAYGGGFQCLQGRCSNGDCTKSGDCPSDAPICGTGSDCRGCKTDKECQDKNGVTSGYVCDVDTGLCQKGECYPYGVECCGDNGAFRKDTYKCDPTPVDEPTYDCSTAACGGNVMQHLKYRFCTGKQAACDNNNVNPDLTGTVFKTCVKGYCVENGSTADCIDCPTGCANGTCTGSCIPGVCCTDAGEFKPGGTVCNPDTGVKREVCVSNSCGGTHKTLRQIMKCEGTSDACSVPDWEDIPGASAPCPSNSYCEGDGICKPCSFGCTNGACNDCTPGSGPCCSSAGKLLSGTICSTSTTCSLAGCGGVAHTETIRCTGNSAACNGTPEKTDNQCGNGYCSGSSCHPCGSQVCYAGTCKDPKEIPIDDIAVKFCNSYDGGDGWDTEMGAGKLAFGPVFNTAVDWYSGAGDTEFPKLESCSNSASAWKYQILAKPTYNDLTLKTQWFWVEPSSSGKACFDGIYVTGTVSGKPFKLYKAFRGGTTCGSNGGCVGNGASYCWYFSFDWVVQQSL